jgi:hypothetical protein
MIEMAMPVKSHFPTISSAAARLPMLSVETKAKVVAAILIVFFAMIEYRLILAGYPDGKQVFGNYVKDFMAGDARLKMFESRMLGIGLVYRVATFDWAAAYAAVAPEGELHTAAVVDLDREHRADHMRLADDDR